MNPESGYEANYEEIDLRELIVILWKWKRIVIAITVLAIITAVIISFIIKPVYETTATLYLGNFNSSIYNDQEYARPVMLADENLKGDKTLAGIIASYPVSSTEQKMQSFFEAVTVGKVDKTKIVKVSVKHTDPRIAVEIADRLTGIYLEKSNDMFKQKCNIAENKIRDIENGIKEIDNEILQSKKQLEVLENGTNTIEKDMAASRLQSSLMDFQARRIDLLYRLQTVKDQLLDYNPAKILTPPGEPQWPVSPNKKLIVAASGMLALMGGCFLAFVLESLKNNPIKLA